MEPLQKLQKLQSQHVTWLQGKCDPDRINSRRVRSIEKDTIKQNYGIHKGIQKQRTHAVNRPISGCGDPRRQ